MAMLGSYLGTVGSLLGDFATTDIGNGLRQQQQSQYFMNALQGIGNSYRVHWDDNEIKKIRDSDYYGKEGEVKTILQRLRKETHNFIGDRLRI